MVGLICHTKDRVGSLEIPVSRELQTGSTGLAVEAVPEREVSCLRSGVCSGVTVYSPQGMGFTGALGWTGSCKLDLLLLL